MLGCKIEVPLDVMTESTADRPTTSVEYVEAVVVCLDMRHFFSWLLIGREKKERSDWLIAKIWSLLIG